MNKLKQLAILKLIMVENLQSQRIIELGIPIRWRKLGFEKIDYYDFGTVQFEHRCIYILCFLQSKMPLGCIV